MATRRASMMGGSSGGGGLPGIGSRKQSYATKRLAELAEENEKEQAEAQAKKEEAL